MQKFGDLKQALTALTSRKALWVIAVSAVVGIIAGFAVPGFIRAYTIPASNACANNLRLIESGKEQCALEQRKTNGAAITWNELLPYIGREGKMPHCPDGGTYILGKIGEQPRCSLGGRHTLSDLN